MKKRIYRTSLIQIHPKEGFVHIGFSFPAESLRAAERKAFAWAAALDVSVFSIFYVGSR